MPSLYDLLNNPDYNPEQSLGQPAYTAPTNAYTPNELPLIRTNKPSTLRRRFLENLIPSSLNVRNRGLMETLKLVGMDLGNQFTAPIVGRAAEARYNADRGTRESFAARGLGGSGLEANELMNNKEAYGRSVLEGERVGSEAENERQLNLMQQLFGITQADLQFLTNLEAGQQGQLRNVTGSGVGAGIGAGLAGAKPLYQGLKDLVKTAYNSYNSTGSTVPSEGGFSSANSNPETQASAFS